MIRAITVILTAILIASCDTGITEPEPETANVDGITAPITEGVTPMDAMAKTSGKCVPNSIWKKTVNKLRTIRNETRAEALYLTLTTFKTEQTEPLPGYPPRYGSAPSARTAYTADELKTAWEQVGPSKWAPLGSVVKALDCVNAPEIPAKVAETYNALMAIYEALNGHSWTYDDGNRLLMNTSWRWGQLSDTPSMWDVANWMGVEIAPSGEKVIGLHISSQMVTTAGPLPPEIGNLTDLKYLRIQGGYYDGGYYGVKGSIPAEIGKLTNLIELQLDGNELTGSIPPEIGNMTNIEFLSLDNNQLTGSIPAEIGKWGNRLPRSARFILLEHNQLTGAIPRELKYMRDLQMYLMNNNGLCYYPDMYEWIRDVAPSSWVDRTPQIPQCE